MKIEPGKYYKTRDGRKAYVEYKSDDLPRHAFNACYFGRIEWPDGSIGERSWHECGLTAPTTKLGCDLVSEWTEPKTYKVSLFFTSENELKAARIASVTKEKDRVLFDTILDCEVQGVGSCEYKLKEVEIEVE